MEPLAELLAQGVEWDLEGLVQEANARLPLHLPRGVTSRGREALTPRLVRHYVNLGVLDPPLRRGRRAYYTPRHLLQLLVLRRLMAEGHASSALRDLVRQYGDEELLAILEAGATLAPSAPNPALAYLEEIRAGLPPSSLPRPPSTSSPTSQEEALWHRFALAPGLEVLVREDFQPPRTPAAMEALLRRLQDLLEDIPSSRKARRRR